jgi:predicted  nucleic acid-binding Zn-ribbon protein
MINAQVTMPSNKKTARATPSASKDLPDVEDLCERLLRQQPQSKALLERLLARSRRTGNRHVFAAVRGNRCSACNMTVASAQMQKVKGGEFINCAHCSIFLYHQAK